MHVEKINTIEKLEALGAEGTDASLDISLGEYSLAWIKGEDETIFIYSIGNKRFDRTSFDNDLDVYREFNWVNWDALFSFVGVEKESFDKYSLSQKIIDLLSYYGYENIFGSSYWEGFEIEGVEFDY
jgi:hypothetical protein